MAWATGLLSLQAPRSSLGGSPSENKEKRVQKSCFQRLGVRGSGAEPWVEKLWSLLAEEQRSFDPESWF